MRQKMFIAASCAAVLCVLVLTGCGGKVQDKVIATVNGEPVYVKDLNYALEFDLKKDPAFKVTPENIKKQLGILIDKKVIIQEARRKKLDQTERFVATIKTFWEQTLVRDMLIHKDNEIKSAVGVSEKEVDAYYNDKLSRQRTFKLLKSKDKTEIAKLIKSDPASVKWEETIGPINYDDISSELIAKAFEIPVGKIAVIKEGDTYCLFYASGDAKASLAPISEIKNDVKQRLINEKKQVVFKRWLEDIRTKSKISVNDVVLKEAGAKI